jgi:hypothetical protein
MPDSLVTAFGEHAIAARWTGGGKAWFCLPPFSCDVSELHYATPIPLTENCSVQHVENNFLNLHVLNRFAQWPRHFCV